MSLLAVPLALVHVYSKRKTPLKSGNDVLVLIEGFKNKVDFNCNVCWENVGIFLINRIV